MLDMQNNRKLNQTVNQSINQSINEKTKTNKQKKKQKSVFTPASVRLSKNTTGEKKKRSPNERSDRQRVKAWTNNKSTVEEAEN